MIEDTEGDTPIYWMPPPEPLVLSGCVEKARKVSGEIKKILCDTEKPTATQVHHKITQSEITASIAIITLMALTIIFGITMCFLGLGIVGGAAIVAASCVMAVMSSNLHKQRLENDLIASIDSDELQLHDAKH